MQRVFIPIVLALLASSCGPADQVSEPAKQDDRQAMIERPTPLNEEVDQVSPIRDQVLKRSGR